MRSTGHPIARVETSVAWCRIATDSLFSAWLCSLPILLLWVGTRPQKTLVFGPCHDYPIDLRPPLLLVSLATCGLILLYFYRCGLLGRQRVRALGATGYGSRIEPSRLFSKVSAVRKAAVAAVMIVHLVAGGTLVWSMHRDGLMDALGKASLHFCANADWSRITFPSLPAVVSMLPFFAVLAPALVAVVFVAWYAAATPYRHRVGKAPSGTSTSLKDPTPAAHDELTSWVQCSLSAAAQRRVLEDQSLVRSESWPYSSTYAIIVWLARAGTLFPNRPSSNSVVSEHERDDYGLRFHEQGALYRVVYGPLLAPWFGLMVAPMLMYSYFHATFESVPKPVFLPSIVVWLGWSVQLAAAAASADGLYAMTIQRNALSRSQALLWASFPGTEFLRRAVTRHTWPGLTASMNVIVAVLFAALLGWYGAH